MLTMFQQLTREIDFLPKIMKIHDPVKKNSNYLHCNFYNYSYYAVSQSYNLLYRTAN